jgi:y4mF family transcriptional regulator
MSNQIGEKVQEMRKQAGLTQEELAYRAGVGLRFLRELEQGKATVRMDKVSQVLEFLGCHLRVEKNGRKE